MKDRINIDQYAMLLALTASTRSEDPHNKVGCVALTKEGRIIATGYNGLPPGKVRDAAWWADREKRLKYIIHAEQNLCSLFHRNVKIGVVATTMSPCSSCANLLIAHGVTRVIYRDAYERDPSGLELLIDAGVEVVHMARSDEPYKIIAPDILDRVAPDDLREFKTSIL